MTENIKPAESLTVADFQAHPVWEFLNDDEIGETMVQPVEKLPVETLDNRLIGTQVRLANGSLVWALIGNFDVTNPRATQHFLTLSRLTAVASGFTLRGITTAAFWLKVQRRLLGSWAYTLTMYSQSRWTFGDTFGEVPKRSHQSC
jgi:hypothetical protein